MNFIKASFVIIMSFFILNGHNGFLLKTTDTESIKTRQFMYHDKLITFEYVEDFTFFEDMTDEELVEYLEDLERNE